jgi:hypothetical protein
MDCNDLFRPTKNNPVRKPGCFYQVNHLEVKFDGEMGSVVIADDKSADLPIQIPIGRSIAAVTPFSFVKIPTAIHSAVVPAQDLHCQFTGTQRMVDGVPIVPLPVLILSVPLLSEGLPQPASVIAAGTGSRILGSLKYSGSPLQHLSGIIPQPVILFPAWAATGTARTTRTAWAAFGQRRQDPSQQ